jgi:hypothetical protein
LADSLSRKHSVVQTEWTIHQPTIYGIFSRWGRPHIDLFATRLNRRLPLFVSPVPDPLAVNVDALTLDWTGLDAYAFPPPALLGLVLRKIELERSVVILLAPNWPAHPWFPLLLSLLRDSSKTTGEKGSSHPAPIAVGASEAGGLQVTRLETIQRALRKKGFSERVSSSIARARRISTERIYQSHWRCWVDWSERWQVDPSDPLVQQLCEFLMFLTQEKKFSQGTVKSYRSAICTTIRQSGGPDLSINPILRELVNSLKINVIL